MSLVLPPFFHWSPSENRAQINRRGLRATCPTMAPIGIPMPGGARELDPDASVYAVCLGTTPSHAWSLSGGIWAQREAEWDLWQVTLDDDDAVHPLPFYGYRLAEVRVANAIPKSRVWYVASRFVKKHGPR